MASLLSLAAGGNLHKLEPDVRKLSPTSVPLTKTLSYPRSPLTSEGSLEASLRPRNAREALSLLKEGTSIDTAFYVPLLQQCIETKSLPDAEIIHAHIIKTGTHEDPFISTTLINVYMKCGSTEFAYKLFDKLPQRNVVSWTSLITGYIHNSRPDDAILVFVQLLESGLYPSHYTLAATLNACCVLYAIELGKQVHGYLIKYGIESKGAAGNPLCNLYSKCGSLASSVKAFRRIADKDVVSWTTIISACGDNDDSELGLTFFADMLSECVEPNEYTLTSVLSLCCMVQDVALGKQIHSFCIKFGCKSQPRVKSTIMYLYLKCGEADEARRLFDEMDAVGLITWNEMISGHAQMMNLAKDDDIAAHRSGLEALKMFHLLNQSGVKPDHFTFPSILSVCGALLALEQGEQIHALTIKNGCLSDLFVSSALVNMYNKSGCIENATKAFVEMPRRTSVAWTSMLTAYSQHGHSKEAIQLFEDMRLAGVRPNQITFTSVLSACSQAGMVADAEFYFYMMKNEYGIKPVMDHYTCMVDLFVRQGRLEDAFAFTKKMDAEPNEVIWSILIAGCRSLGNMDLGYYAAERLLELKPKRIETYILLLNMYMSAERWQDVSRVRKLMKDENIGTIRDRSRISIKDKVYFFRANDRSHPQSAEVYELLENLLQKATCLGYVPYESVGLVEKEDEENSLGSTTRHHSERLAIAFGLINTTEGMTIRVVKNVTMCRDCHNAVKFFSMLTKREIIVKDSKRLHRFKDGKCSCGDFGALL